MVSICSNDMRESSQREYLPGLPDGVFFQQTLSGKVKMTGIRQRRCGNDIYGLINDSLPQRESVSESADKLSSNMSGRSPDKCAIQQVASPVFIGNAST